MKFSNNSFQDSGFTLIQSRAHSPGVVRRISSGIKIHTASIPSDLSVPLELLPDKYLLRFKISYVHHLIHDLQAQLSSNALSNSFIHEALVLILRYNSTTRNVRGHEVDFPEFSELSNQLKVITRESFNGIILFSGTSSEIGLYIGTLTDLNALTELGKTYLTLRHVFVHENGCDLYEPGDPTKNGFRTLQQDSFSSFGSEKQMTALIIGGKIPKGDKPLFKNKKQNACLNTESDTTVNYLACSDTENAPDPREIVRSELYDHVNPNTIILDFLDIQKFESNQLTPTLRISVSHNQLNSTGSTDSLEWGPHNSEKPCPRNATKEDRITHTLPDSRVFTGESISIDLPVGEIFPKVIFTNPRAPVTSSDPTYDMAAYMFYDLSPQLNSKNSIDTEFVYKNGHYIYVDEEGIGFCANNLTQELNPPNAGSIIQARSTSIANNARSRLFESTVTITDDNTFAGGRKRLAGEPYNISISESHPLKSATHGWTPGPERMASTSSPETYLTVVTGDNLLDRLETCKAKSDFQDKGSSLFDLQKIGNNHIKITGQKFGDTFTLNIWADTPAGYLNDLQNASNISQFRIEKTIEYFDAMLTENASGQSRIKHSHARLQKEIVATNSPQERLSATYYPQDSTTLMRESLSMQMITQVMPKTICMKDLLIPLTTNHHRGSVHNFGT